MGTFAAAPAAVVQVVTGRGTSYALHIDSDLESYAKYLFDLLCNRAQWTKVSNAVESITKDCWEYLSKRLPDVNSAIQDVAAQDVVEVRIPATAGEAVRRFPWEFVLAEISRKARKDRKRLLVVRQLVGAPNRPPSPAPAIAGERQVAIVRSEPGKLAGEFSFDSEENLVIFSFAGEGTGSGDARTAPAPKLLPAKIKQLKDPTLSGIRDEVGSFGYDVVHVTGIDGWQGAALLDMPVNQTYDGVFLPDENGAPVIASSEAMASALCATRPPRLVGFNLYYSSANTAALAVAKGAEAAIGFQDEVDDGLAERFFALFYDVWHQTSNLLAAFQAAFNGLTDEHDRLRGSGIVLWSANSLVGSKCEKARPRSFPVLNPDHIVDSRQVLSVEVRQCDKLNYSMLHNNRPLFKTFRIKRQGRERGVAQGVRVEVVLHAGTEKSTYSAAFDLTEWTPVVDVNSKARVSLTSELGRSLQESVFSSLYVSVTWGRHTILQETYRVSLLPTDEWQDDDLNRVWLPSFVLPRDSAVLKLIDTAQRYLVAIADRSDAGFDGYQETENAGVDAQVQAIWWALVQDIRLAYINPPPTFTKSAQRLRTPGDCITGKRGTCIDLALLLAAGLEYIDMYPVVFLLEGHAFPGYCRSEKAHQDVMSLQYKLPQTGSTNNGPVQNPARMRRKPEVSSDWILDQRYYPDIVRMVQTGAIVPIETTMIAGAAGFAQAVEQGIQNLRNRSEFQYLVDIAQARERGVTPIPRWSLQ